MMDQQRQSNKDQADGIPEALERELRELHLGMKQAFLYPVGHPVRARAAGEICGLLQRLLSSQESHSLTTVEDKLYIDQHETGIDGQEYIASDEISTDIARKLRRRGIRSVVFSQGVELSELERFLDIMTMRAKEVMDAGGAGELLRSASDVSHIEIVDIEYEDIRFVADDSKEDSMDEEEILVLHIRGSLESLTDAAYAYLLSLLDKPELMARLIEKCVGYDGVHEPDSTIVVQCIDKLISLGERFSDTDEERKDFRRKLLEATLYMERPVKNALFSAYDDNDTVARLMHGLSTEEITRFVTMECATEDPSVPMRRMFDESLSDQSSVSGSLDGRVTEIEAAIQSKLVERKQEDAFNNTVVPLLEEAFVGVEVGVLERLLHAEQKKEIEDSIDEMINLFAAEDEIVNFAAILLEMLESETDSESYLDIVDQLEEIAKFLIMGPQDVMDVQVQHVAKVFHIVDALSGHADPKSDRPVEFQRRARKAIANISTEEFIDRVLSSSLRASYSLEWDALERFIQQMGEKAVSPLIKNLLDVKNPPDRRKLGKTLVSIGAIVVPELRRWLSQGQWVAVIKDIMPILSEIGGTEALDCFSDALNHPNPQVRRSAISALSASKSPGAMELVLSKIRDDKEEESIRQLAISVLGEMGDEQVIEEIERVIRGKNAILKREAIYALGNIGGEKSIPVLLGILKQKRLILGRRRLEGLQLHAVEALSQIGTQSAIEVLMEMSQKKKGKVKSACDAALQSYHQTPEN